MNPGQSFLCRQCRHFILAGWEQGHPNPCRMNHWSGNVHHSPAIAADGKQCDEFEAKPVENSPLKPRSEVPNRPKSDVERTPQAGVST